MSEPSLTGTAIQPAPAAPKPRGNPNLHLAPRCGARTRAGCPCRAPAIRGKLRCRMHGGRSTGPRTPEGLGRLRAARTIHGHYTAATRAQARFIRTFARRGRLWRAVMGNYNRLPPTLRARLAQAAPELDPLACPPTILSATEEQAFRRGEAEALAPWKAALAAARAMGRRSPAETNASLLAFSDHYAPVVQAEAAGPADLATPAPRAPHAAGALAPVPPPPARPSARSAAEVASAPAVAKPLAPERSAVAAPGAVKPHTPVSPRATGTPQVHALPGGLEDRGPGPLAPDRALAPAAAGQPNRATRRWLRKQERLRDKRAAVRRT